MIKIALAKVEWTQNVSAGGDFSKSLAANQQRGVRLWYLGHGVLVEHEGKPSRMVPIGNVLAFETCANVTADEWLSVGAEAPAVEPNPPLDPRLRVDEQYEWLAPHLDGLVPVEVEERPSQTADMLEAYERARLSQEPVSAPAPEIEKQSLKMSLYGIDRSDPIVQAVSGEEPQPSRLTGAFYSGSDSVPAGSSEPKKRGPGRPPKVKA